MNKHISIFAILCLLLSSSLNFSQTTSGLIGYWPFNGNACDLSGYVNNGNVHNAVLTTDRFGHANSAYYFSGNSYINCGREIVQVYDQITISLWLKTDSYFNNAVSLISKNGSLTGNKGFVVNMQGNLVQFVWQDNIYGNNSISSGNKSYNDNNWHHVVGTLAGSSGSLWVDGVKVGSLNNNHTNVDISQNYDLYIGVFLSEIGPGSYFTGFIDDVRLYNRTLTDSEIQVLYNDTGIKIGEHYTTGTINPSNSGTISGTGVFSAGSTVNLVATPKPGHKFLNWTENGNVVSTNSTYTYTITSDRNLVANFGLIQYQITTINSPVSGGTSSGTGIYDYDYTVQVVATPNTGYKFLNWSEGSTLLSTHRMIAFDVQSDRTLTANFGAATFNLTTSTLPLKGGTVTGAGVYDYYSNVQVVAKPNEGYKFLYWTENGTVVTSNSSYGFIITADRNLTANFVQTKAAITLSCNPTAGGIVSGNGFYDIGTIAFIDATPNNGFLFVNWTENGNIVSTNPTYSFAVTTDRNLIANFSSISQFTVTTSCNPAAGGSASGSGIYINNANVQVVATPNTGYRFVNWKENGTAVSTNPTYSFTITGNRNLIANFAIITFTVTTSVIPVAGGITTGGDVYNYNAIVQVIALPNAHFRFVNWTENGAVVSTDAIYSFTITGNRNLVANFFKFLCSVVTSSNPAAGGATSGGGEYTTGDNVLVIGTPNPGYTFVNWTENGNEVSKSPYYSFTINADRNLTANFATTPILSVSPLYIGVNSNAGTGNFTVSNITGGSMNWTAFSNSSWITIASGRSGTNSGTINISFQANPGSYRVATVTVSSNGAIGDPQTVEVRQSPFTSVDMLNSVPTNFTLYQNYPNPFNPTTRIQLGIPEESFVILKVYDVLGNEIESLINQTLSPGTYFANFDASKLNNGIYFYRLQAGEFNQTKKMTLLK